MTDSRRIVAASSFWLGSSADGLTQGLRKLGWDIYDIDMRSYLFGASAGALRLLARAIRPASIAAYNAAILDAVAALQPRAFFTVKGSYLKADTLSTIRRQGVKTIMYYPDFHVDHADIDHQTFALYDQIFTNNSFLVPLFAKHLGTERVTLLYFGYSPHMHYPRLKRSEERDFVADCGYVGTYTPYKMRWLQAIVRDLPDMKLMVIGAGWCGPAKQTPLAASVAGYQLVGDTYSRFLQQVRINIAIHMGPHGKESFEDNVSMRTFEIPACKGFMLHIDNAEVRELFEPGKEIDVFSTPEELREKVKYYLSKPELRGRMIERAYARCAPAYSYDIRAEAISRVI